ncbi:AIPR family protein [Rhodopseudomonas palustris]|uniref:AIPR family protein n=1 Tax=Rhodopseudomonas palustris TaxID=1076 RepID=UPI00115D0390|nr:AIPR family protein [Rhodopseudomonas palustris]QDL98893.1 AIPR family protein [Rhodopseudomonas palustris]
MAEVQHSQIKSKLLEIVAPLVDQSDISGKAPSDVETHSLSRSMAVAAVKILAEIEYDAAVASLVDGGKDNGIDAIYYDAQAKTLYLVQSKWSNSHASSIASGEVLKFLQGVQDLVSLKKGRFNEKIQKRWSVIEDSLKRLTSVRLVIAYPGSGKVDPDIQSKIDDFLKSQNDTSDLFFFSVLTQRELFQHFVHEAAPPQIDLTIRLTHYGLVESPLRAVYGQVSAVDVASWYRTHGNNLFVGNIRNFLGSSEVNSAIEQTLVGDPAHFWFYNNGITIITTNLKRQPIGGNDRSVGIFDCGNVTIVNGAQTVGTIGRGLVGDDSSAFLQVRVIEVSDPDSSLGKLITRASNTQNKIDARNFVALDPEQERIRTELLIEKVAYEYREGEPLESTVDGFEFIEGIAVLACASDEISFVALSKGYVGGLYADINTTPYKALFNPSTSSLRLWSLVQLARRIDLAIKKSADQSSPTQRGIVVHGNRFTLHCILRRISQFADISASPSIAEDVIGDAVMHVLAGVSEIIDADYADAYLAPLFKNVKKCTDIRMKYEKRS